MDVIQQLATAMGVDATTATAVAGSVLGAARDQAGGDVAAKLTDAVPELQSWASAAAPAAPDQPGVLDDLARFAASSAGGGLIGALAGPEAAKNAQAAGLLAQLGLQPSHAALAAPVLLSFLEERLGGVWLERLLQAAPIVAGLKGGPPTGGVAELLGGWLK